MSPSTLSRRPSLARLFGALFAVSLLASGCSEDAGPAAEESPAVSEASDAGGQEPMASDGGSEEVVVTGTSDGGGKSVAAVPAETVAVTPAPEGFEPPAACSGEGAYFAEVGGSATPDLPERGGETLTIGATGISGDDAQLTAMVGDGEARPIEDITLGETAEIGEWTISVTSVCAETEQIEFDLIN